MLAWNARYITRVLDHRADTHPELAADDAALSRLAPVSHAHINPLGRYRFDNPDAPPPGQLRPLHRPDADEYRGQPTSPIGVNGDKHLSGLARKFAHVLDGRTRSLLTVGVAQRSRPERA